MNDLNIYSFYQAKTGKFIQIWSLITKRINNLKKLNIVFYSFGITVVSVIKRLSLYKGMYVGYRGSFNIAMEIYLECR